MRVAGSDAVRKHWPGTGTGLAVLWKLGGFEGDPPPSSEQRDAETVTASPPNHRAQPDVEDPH